MKSLKLAAILLIGNLLLGCHTEKDQNYFLTHLNELDRMYVHCTALTGPEAFSDKTCVAAIQAAQQLKPIVISAAQTPAIFGMTIGNTQKRIQMIKNHLKDKTLNDAAQKALKVTLQQEESTLRTQYAVINLLRSSQ